MRLFYTLLFYLLVPFILFRLYWRGFKAPDYRKRWAERLAIYNQTYTQNVIWIHAVSVGEAEAVFPLVKILQQKYPSDQFLVTTTTPTGSARVQAVLGETVNHVYLPYDLPCVIKRFMTVFSPKIAVFMEKEIWPNLYNQCAEYQIPLLIINARLSANSAKGYKKIASLVKPALNCVNWIATQTEEDRQRFIEIGAKKAFIHAAGNIKFDLQIDEKQIQLARQIKTNSFKNRFVWIIASTHEGEEKIFFELYSELKKLIPELLLIVVPRHPERFNKVQTLAERMCLKTCMRSSGLKCSIETDVYIADTMGELKLLYGTADISFVAGSMLPIGGHNMLEAAVMKVPIMFGPHMINFKDIAQNVLDIGAAVQCKDADEISAAVLQLYRDDEFRYELVTKAQTFVKNNQGVTSRIDKLIDKFMA